MLRPRINRNIKILTAVLLAGFILFNIVFIGYTAEPQCASPVAGECPAGFKPAKSGEPCEFCIKETSALSTPSQSKTEQPKYLKNPSGAACPSGYEKSYTLDTGEQICKLPGSATPGAFDVKVSTDTYKSAGDCRTFGFPADKNGKCPKNTERISCPEDPNKYRCFQIVVEQSEIQKYTTYSKIPCQPSFGGTCPKAEEGPAQYLARLYQFGLMIAGLAAFGSIVYGSLKYILSAGNIGSTEEAKDIIRQAIYGLVLLLGAYLILYTINPNLVNLRNPEVPLLDIDLVIKKGALPDEQRLPPSSNEEHPLCQSGVGSDLTIQSNIKFEGPISTLVGGEKLPSEVKGFVCLKCKANAVKSSVSDCKCDAGFVPNDAGNNCIRPVGVTAPELLPKQQVPTFDYQPPNYVELPKQQ